MTDRTKPKYFKEIKLIDTALINLQGKARLDFVDSLFESVLQKGRQEMRDEIREWLINDLGWDEDYFPKFDAKFR